MKNSWNAGSEMFDPIRKYLELLPEEDWPGLEMLTHLASSCRNEQGNSISFVEHDGEAYEQRIHQSGEVQTRQQCWHDLFNDLVWMTYPGAKSRLNAAHVKAMSRENNGRGSLRDIATLVDESGILVASCSDTLSGMLKGFEWKSLFVENRQRVAEEMRFYIFGHGLYEKALSPFVGLTGHALIFPVEKSFFGLPLDEQLQRLDAAFDSVFSGISSTRDLCPLPVLGVPGWSPDNEDPAYYDNERYFRRGRIRDA